MRILKLEDKPQLLSHIQSESSSPHLFAVALVCEVQMTRSCRGPKHACMRKQSNRTPRNICAQTPPALSCTYACFSGMCFGLVQAKHRYSISLHISIHHNHLSLWQNASQHSLSKTRSSAASYPVEAWDSVLRRPVAGSACIAGMPFGVVVQVSFRSLVPSRRLEACLPVEPGSARG